MQDGVMLEVNLIFLSSFISPIFGLKYSLASLYIPLVKVEFYLLCPS